MSISMFTQKFIKIFHSVQEIGPLSLFQNLALGKASTDDKCHFAIFLGLDLFNIKLSAKFYQNIPNGLRISFTFSFKFEPRETLTNPKCHLTISWARLHLVNTNVYAKFHHNIPLSSRDKAIFTFSEFGVRQNLDQSQMSFDNPMGYILSILMCMQNFITIFHSVQEIGLLSLFQNLALGKASTDDKCHFAIVTLFSEFEPRQNLDQSQMSFDNLMMHILSISVCMQNFITIFCSVQERAPSSLFQNLEPGKASTNEKCHFAIFGLDLVNINVYTIVYQNIPLSLRDRAIFTFSIFGAQQSLDQ